MRGAGRGQPQITARLCRNMCRGRTKCTPLAGACGRDVTGMLYYKNMLPKSLWRPLEFGIHFLFILLTNNKNLF
jgi:hypothetical protein